MEYLVLFAIILIAATGYILSIKNNRPAVRKTKGDYFQT